MPPKTSSANKPSKKNVEKKKEKIIEDKTFGMKNKKGAKAKKEIAMIHNQVKNQGKTPRQLQEEKKKEADKLAKKNPGEAIDAASLFKPVVQKLGKGTDPKSVICAFFKQGTCGKGAKCKFSHDLAIQRKGEKKALYEDKESDTMDDWDEETLREVIEKKHGASDKNKPTTEIVCKHFIQAVENSKYGWFWSCPSGDSCIYKHALPEGYVLEKDKKKVNKDDEISIEDLVEKERAALPASTTKVTLESFLKWKKKKLAEKKSLLKQTQEKKKTKYKGGNTGGMSGRDMFTFNPDLATADAGGDDEAMELHREEEEERSSEERVVDVCTEEFEGGEYKEFKKEAQKPTSNGQVDDEAVGGVPIDEDLFAEDDEDLDDLEEELENLDLEEAS